MARAAGHTCLPGSCVRVAARRTLPFIRHTPRGGRPASNPRRIVHRAPQAASSIASSSLSVCFERLSAPHPPLHNESSNARVRFPQPYKPSPILSLAVVLMAQLLAHVQRASSWSRLRCLTAKASCCGPPSAKSPAACRVVGSLQNDLAKLRKLVELVGERGTPRQQLLSAPHDVQVNALTRFGSAGQQMLQRERQADLPGPCTSP